PADYVGQEPLELSTAPILAPGALCPRHVLLRSYLVASAESPPYAVMPGGLTRCAATADTLVVSMQKGGGSKDTWVLSETPVSTSSLRPPTAQRVAPSSAGGALPSRAADNLFWLARYAERVESIVRLVRVIVARATEQAGLTEAAEISRLLNALADST